MILVAKKFGVCCDVRVASQALKGAMPVWYHIGEESGRSMANTKAGKCLRKNHGVKTVAQADLVTRRLRPEDPDHVPRRDCECAECVSDRMERGCENPHKCALAAERLVERLRPMWNLAQDGAADGLSLTQCRKEANVEARANDERILFEPSITQDSSLSSVFRAFTNPVRATTVAALRPPRPFNVEEEEVEVFTDGSCIHNGMAGAVAGSGVWFGTADPRNEGARVPYDAQSNQTAEIYAVTMAVRKVPPFAPLHIVSD
ncbi:RNase H, partial [Trametes versicolor FP-101664 SS1]|uniref:RNase H n=1 Tax=Trametes versicolor (strain FP-101664) TaxID=717944 RepID=UPI00046225F7